MKRSHILIGAAGLFLAASGSHAADIYESEGAYREPIFVPAIGWSGFYVGGSLGVTLSDEVQGEKFDGSVVEISGALLEEALTAGIHIGYNRQTLSNWVLGIEADLTTINDEIGEADVTDYLATVRGRLGIASGNSLLYTTAGLAFLNYDDAAAQELEIDNFVGGFVVGAGFEHKLSSNWSLGMEALYYDFSKDTLDNEAEIDRELWNLRARVSYQLNRGYAEPLK